MTGARAGGCGLAVLLPLLGGCATLWPPVDARSPQAVPAVISCARTAVQALGYKIVRSGPDELEGQKTDTTARLAPEDYQRYDDLTVRATPGDAAGGSALHLVPGTVTVRISRAGRFEKDEPASPGVQRDARAVVQRCGG
ncbi:MAG TPA: hypothetical protein VFW98_13090 [Gemmatimonadaceae bacterium]|nr:hypothetical protein [Gemmatimonadaceae bacterium]